MEVRSADDAAAGVARLERLVLTNSPAGPAADLQFLLRFSEAAPYVFKRRTAGANRMDPAAAITQSQPGQFFDPRYQISESGYFNAGFPAVNGLTAAGLAESGTRLLARFGNIPEGVTVYVTAQPLESYTSPGVSAQLIAADPNGAGPYLPLPAAFGIRGGTVPVVALTASNGEATATWEILDPTVDLDRVSFGVFLSYAAAPDATVSVQGMLGPIAPSGNVTVPPRFVPGLNPVAAAVIGAGGGGVVTPPTGGVLTIAAPAALPVAVAGQAYAPFQLTATPATAGLSWTLVDGSFPPGMTLAATGVIGGVPAFPGTYTFTVRATALFNQTATARLTIVVRTPQVTLPPANLIEGAVGSAITPVTLAASGGSLPLVWFARPGSLPPGISLTAEGVLSGIPSVEGPFSVPVFATDAAGSTSSVTVTFFIAGLLRIATPAPLPRAVAGAFYRTALEAAGGSPSYRWAIVAGALPFGLTMDNTGVIQGTAVAGAESGFVVEVADAQGRAARRSYVVEAAGNGQGLAGVRTAAPVLRFYNGSNRRPVAQVITLAPTNVEPVNVSVSVRTDQGTGWLRVDRTSVTVALPDPEAILVEVEPRPEGTYSGAVILRVGDEVREIPVTFSSTIEELWEVAPEALQMTAIAGGAVTARHRIAVWPPIAQPFTQPAVSTVPWLRVVSAAAGVVEVEANPAGLSPGVYEGAVNTGQRVNVTLRVLAAEAIPPVEMDTSAVILQEGAGGFQVSNVGRTSAFFTARDFGASGFNWFRLTPDTRTLDAGAAQAVRVEATAALTPGVRRGFAGVSLAGSGLRWVEIVALDGGPDCRASRLVPVVMSPGADQTFAAGETVKLEVAVVDNCGRAVTGPAGVAVIHSEGGIGLLPVEGAGRWLGSWTVSGSVAGPVRLVAVARGNGLEGVAETVIGVTPGPARVVTAVVSAGTFPRGRAVGPEAMVSIFGTGLGDTVEVQMGGSAARVVSVRANQVNAVVPAGVRTNATLAVTLLNAAGQRTVPVLLPVTAQAPDVFVTGANRQGIVTDLGFRLVDAGRPAAAGEVLIVFCTGLGLGRPPATNLSVTVGGAAAEVIDAAAAPGFPGLYQVAIRLGAGTPEGGATPVVVTAGGWASPVVFIATRR